MALKQAYFAGFGPFTYDDSVITYGGVFDAVSIGNVVMSGASQTTENFSIAADLKALVLGAGGDAKIYYDGNDLVVKPNVVGSGEVKVDGYVNTTSAYKVDGTVVLGNQQAAITNPTGGSTVDDECRAALISLLDALRTHGVIAT